MSRSRRLALLLWLVPAALPGQEPTGFEVGPLALATLAREGFAGGGLSLGWRPGGGVRLVVATALGARDGGAAGRGELLGHLMLTPARRSGVGVYGVGGIAGTIDGGRRGDLVLGLGLESRPAAGWGVALEGGVGGGVRLMLAVRRRWLRPAPAGGG